MSLTSRKRYHLVIPGLTALLVVAITAFAGHTGESRAVPASLRSPTKPLAIISGTTSPSFAIGISRAFYNTAPVVIVSAADAKAQKLAASAASELGVPALVDDRRVPAELKRLRSTLVVVIGKLKIDIVPARVDIAATEAAVTSALPGVRRDEAYTRTPLTISNALVLSASASRDAVALASARNAGATVVMVPGGDPRRVASAAKILRDSKESPVLALGNSFARTLPYTLSVVRTAPPLLGGGKLLFPGRLMVALYGHPGAPSLGVLGEKGLRTTIVRAKKLAAGYQRHTARPVVPTFEIITTVASSSPGKDKDYSAEAQVKKIRPWVEAANKAGVYVVLDLQPGRSDFLSQAKRYESLLRLPHVGLALDPEWRLKKKQKHLRQIGSVGAAEINRTSAWLAALTRKHALPQKVLILHQFTGPMIRNRQAVTTTHPELSIVIHVDGHGTQPEKRGTWRALHNGAPKGVSWGWKNFYDEDKPMLSPQKTLRKVRPLPQFISYQ